MHDNLPPENVYAHTKKLRFIIQHLNSFIVSRDEPINLMDFGCGNGNAVSQYLFQDGVNYYGVDIHEPSLDYARNNYEDDNVKFLNHIPDGILFDVIVYADVIEHSKDPISLLNYHSNILNRDGFIIGSVPNGYGPFEMEKRIDRWLRLSQVYTIAVNAKRRAFGLSHLNITPEQIPYNSECGHVQFFTMKDILLILQQAGFKVNNMTNGAFIGAPFSELLIHHNKRVIKLNAKIADYLPFWAVSTWYFTASKM